MSIATRTSRCRFLSLLAALALAVAACGADETIDAGAAIDEPAAQEPIDEETDSTPEADGEDMAPETSDETTDGFTPMTPRTDLVSLQPATPDEVISDPADDTQLLIRFEGAAEPCSGAAVTVTETEADVTVVLETGLDPNAAAMSCIAQVFDYEITAQLEAPVGDRTITIG